MTNLTPRPIYKVGEGAAHCPLCTHTVPAVILITRKGFFVKPGQKCPRCASTLDAAYVIGLNPAA
jgi:uncharacterized protein (UPF0212 family)